MNSETPDFTPAPSEPQTMASTVAGDDAGSIQPQPAPQGDTVATAAVPAPAQIAPPASKFAWLQRIVGLLPLLAYGAVTMQKDASLGDKDKTAQDALALVVAGASVEVAPEDEELVNVFGTMAQQTLTATVTMIHNAQTPPAAA